MGPGQHPFRWRRSDLSAQLRHLGRYVHHHHADRDRIVTEVNGAGGTAGTVDASDTYNIAGLPDLDLRAFYKGVPIASSASLFDNVEHLHFPVWQAGNALDYEIHVSYPNLFAGANLVDYGLAWWTTAVPEPSTLILVTIVIGMFFARRNGAIAHRNPQAKR